MRKILMTLSLICVMALPMLAQEDYKAEIFGGYQYTRMSGANFNGWTGSATGNVNNWLGITADVSGAYKSESGVSLNAYNFLFGPTVSYKQSEKVKPFVYALFGVSHANAGFFSFNASDNAFAMALGGGVDMGVNKNVAVRLVQADYFLTRFGGASQNNARISTGLVFRF
jgi:opacity protein-like surface antigen